MMELLLFFKPIVDMFYAYPILDIGLLGGLLLVFITGKKSTKIRFEWLDLSVLILALLFFFSYLRYTPGLPTFIKILSGFLLYLVGRISYQGHAKYAKYVKWGFLVVIAMTIKSFLDKTGFIDWGNIRTFRGEYFFKTDLAAAMAQMFIFYAIAPRRTWFTYAMLGIASYFILISNARIYYFIALLLMFFLLLYLREGKGYQRLRINKKLGIILLLLAAGSIYLLNYLNQYFGEDYLLLEVQSTSDLLNNANTQGRSVAWERILTHFFNQSWYDQIVGLDLISDGWIGVICNSHNLYIKILYSTGYMGCGVFLLFLVRIFQTINRTQSPELYYITLSLLTIYLLSGFSYITIESTQLTWLFMFYLGLCKTENQLQSLPSQKLMAS